MFFKKIWVFAHPIQDNCTYDTWNPLMGGFKQPKKVWIAGIEAYPTTEAKE
ncbi:hypothetical protein [Cytobacillus firmus]|uniref:hypothetical protein n=1 Tax=Cytobacillus firmus TaxID=1399 RepID=UPI0018CEA856|nr:hypothetical protein [Cytobacillus firmus]